nr:sigma-70 family RNA polymerase sigma factor [uncultured Anaeromusa sp.]
MQSIEELVQEAQGENKDAFGELCRRFTGLVRSRAGQSFVRSIREDMEGVAWLAFAKAVKDYRSGSGHFEGYAAQCVTYAVWNAFQKECKCWRRQGASLDAEDSQETAASENVEDEVEKKLLKEKLRQALALLSVRQRQVVQGRLQGQTVQEMAKQLEVSHQAVSRLLARAMEKMRCTWVVKK